LSKNQSFWTTKKESLSRILKSLSNVHGQISQPKTQMKS